ncbi:MAG: hypothetical protein QMB98_05125 [Flaviflexus sp.]|uniref:hypothetical protein n=1 Tax=Flaviflexus sp. TaxID=1969482 RepID=UPI00352D2335
MKTAQRLMTVVGLVGIAAGLAACGDDDSGPENTGTEESVAEDTIIVVATNHAKGQAVGTETMELPAVEGESYEIKGMSEPTTTLEVTSIGDGSVTIAVEGAYFLGEGLSENPEFTLEYFDSITFETASEDAGVRYDITYQPAQ